MSRAIRETSLEGQQTYPDFASYFEARPRKPVAVWCELEATYTFVASYRPELLTQLYQVAQKAMYESPPQQGTLSEAMVVSCNNLTLPRRGRVTTPTSTRYGQLIGLP